MNELGIYGTWNGDGSYTRLCCQCEKEFVTRRFRKLRCDECMHPPKKLNKNDCEVCGSPVTKRYIDPQTIKWHRLCPNHYYMVKYDHKVIETLREELKHNE